MTLPATIYARFSSQEQVGNSSKERQLTSCREMIASHKWLGAPDREFVDEGKSAFSGANRLPGGQLYEFEQRALAGLYRNGHVLVVEHLDRISRQGHDEVLPFLNAMTNAGVTVATVDGNRVYPAYERVPLGPVVEAVVKAELAREESEKKRFRNVAAINTKIERSKQYAARGEHVSGSIVVPAWIDTEALPRPTKDDPLLYRMTLNDQRVELIREIFKLTIEGYGTPAIAKRLNARGEPVWTHLGRASNNGWTVGNLTKLVLNRALLGEYDPQNRPRAGEQSSKNQKILNYYPQAIDPVIFAKAQAARQARKGTSGAWQISHGNLFSGIATCRECGGRMKQEITVRKGGLRRNGKNPDIAYGSKQDISYLKCHNAINRVYDQENGQLRCTNRAAVRYEKLERAVVDFAVGWLAVNRQDTSQAVLELEVQIADARRYLAEKQTQADNAAVSFTRTGSPTMERLMLSLEAEVIEHQTAIDQLNKRLDGARSSAPSPDFFAEIEKQKAALVSDNGEERNRARVQMKQTLGSIIKSMQCTPRRDTMIVLGDDAMGLVFDAEGELVQSEPLGSIIYGPHGEPDWHPDEELAE